LVAQCQDEGIETIATTLDYIPIVVLALWSGDLFRSSSIDFSFIPLFALLATSPFMNDSVVGSNEPAIGQGANEVAEYDSSTGQCRCQKERHQDLNGISF
jgi:hypothetical protein